MVQMGFNLYSVRGAVDERRHGGRAEGNAVVVKVLAVNTLHHTPSILLTGRFNGGFKGTVASLFGGCLVGPVETVNGCNGWSGEVPEPRTALPGRIKRVKASVWQIVSIPVSVVASPRRIPHHVGDVRDELRFFIKFNGQPHAPVQGCVRGVEVVVPKFVTRTVPIGGQVQNEGSPLAEAVVGPFDQFNRRINGVSRQPRDEEKSVLASRERFHRFPCKRTVVVIEPIISTD